MVYGYVFVLSCTFLGFWFAARTPFRGCGSLRRPLPVLWFGAPGFLGRIKNVASATHKNGFSPRDQPERFGSQGSQKFPAPGVSSFETPPGCHSDRFQKRLRKHPIMIVTDGHGRLQEVAPNQNSSSRARTDVLDSLFASIGSYSTGTVTDI